MTAQRLTLFPFRSFEMDRSCKSVFKMSITLLAVLDYATSRSNDISLHLKHILVWQAHSSLPEEPHNLHTSIWSRHTVFTAPKAHTNDTLNCTLTAWSGAQWERLDLFSHIRQLCFLTTPFRPTHTHTHTHMYVTLKSASHDTTLQGYNLQHNWLMRSN